VIAATAALRPNESLHGPVSMEHGTADLDFSAVIAAICGEDASEGDD